MSDLTSQEKAVFGETAQRGPDGKIIETGVGSLTNVNENHFAGIRKTQGIEAEKAARKRARYARK